MCVCVCVCACVRTCVHTWVPACVCAWCVDVPQRGALLKTGCLAGLSRRREPLCQSKHTTQQNTGHVWTVLLLSSFWNAQTEWMDGDFPNYSVVQSSNRVFPEKSLASGCECPQAEEDEMMDNSPTHTHTVSFHKLTMECHVVAESLLTDCLDSLRTACVKCFPHCTHFENLHNIIL